MGGWPFGVPAAVALDRWCFEGHFWPAPGEHRHARGFVMVARGRSSLKRLAGPWPFDGRAADALGPRSFRGFG